MRKFKKILSIVTILMLVLTVLPTSVFAKGSYTAYASKSTITVGKTANLIISTTDAAGKFSVTSSNPSVAKVSGSTTWVDGTTMDPKITIKGVAEGTATITVTPVTVADKDMNLLTNTKTIKITVKKASTNTNTTTKKSSNANISKLTLSVEGLSFKTSQTTYNIKVDENTNNISVGVSLESSKATYKVTGNKNLKAGNNVIKIVVTAENGTTKTYKINADKKGNAEDTSAELANLIIEDMTFTTQFISTETEYVGSKMKYIEKLNVLPYTVSEKATYEILGNENLKVGENTIIVKVTSYDETSTMEYKVTFEMLPKGETNALQVVSPYTEKEPGDVNEYGMMQVVKDNMTIILLYILALVEFGQVVYLYIQLKSVNPESVTTIKRRNKK